VELKNFKGPDSTNVKLAATDFDKLTYAINTGPNKAADVSNFIFQRGQVEMKQQCANRYLSTAVAGRQYGQHQFVLKPGQYMVDFNLIINGVPQLLTGNTLNLTWQNRAVQLQKDLEYEKQQSVIAFREDGDYDNEPATSSAAKPLTKPVNWIGVKQQFFNTTLVAKNNFSSGSVTWTAPGEKDKTGLLCRPLRKCAPRCRLRPIGYRAAGIYYGPTDYKILKQYDNEMSNMVDLGSGMFAFVKYINRWIIMPVFDLFRKFTSNYGVVILLLTLFIRLVISPLSYSSYLAVPK
jgi:YidC/Oxa1 family membrane protein insertase